MSVLELKQGITSLDKRGREEIHAYLVRLQHETPEWRRTAASRIRRMKKGEGMTAEKMKTRLRSP